jgi:hypothetical protein
MIVLSELRVILRWSIGHEAQQGLSGLTPSLEKASRFNLPVCLFNLMRTGDCLAHLRSTFFMSRAGAGRKKPYEIERKITPAERTAVPGSDVHIALRNRTGRGSHSLSRGDGEGGNVNKDRGELPRQLHARRRVESAMDGAMALAAALALVFGTIFICGVIYRLLV